uniref:Uncharacterized protein n=1 Tax=Mantoniella antarctica TaxID=81844 RepID=A0A7S0SYT0_9CHLO
MHAARSVGAHPTSLTRTGGNWRASRASKAARGAQAVEKDARLSPHAQAAAAPHTDVAAVDPPSRRGVLIGAATVVSGVSLAASPSPSLAAALLSDRLARKDFQKPVFNRRTLNPNPKP